MNETKSRKSRSKSLILKRSEILATEKKIAEIADNNAQLRP
jgi:hypothetical protein